MMREMPGASSRESAKLIKVRGVLGTHVHKRLSVVNKSAHVRRRREIAGGERYLSFGRGF